MRRRRCERCWPHSRHDAVSSGLKVLIATKPVDFRKGMDGLAALVKAHLGADPFAGTVFVFRAKRADRIKLIVWDGTGLCLFAKRLEEGTFRWPKIEDGIMRPTSAQLSALIEGLDWTRVRDVEVRAPTSAAACMPSHLLSRAATTSARRSDVAFNVASSPEVSGLLL